MENALYAILQHSLSNVESNIKSSHYTHFPSLISI